MTLKVRDSRCIDKDRLIPGSWYRGVGRNSNVGLWNGWTFQTFGLKFGHYVEKREEHWDDEGPFQPLEQILS